MQYLRQTVVALSVLLASVGCSESPTQKELTDETIRLNKTLINEGAINPKTQFLQHDKDVKVIPHVAPKVITTKHVSVSSDIEKLITERDAVIRANVELKKINSDLKSQKLTLIENQSSSKGKIVASATALLAAQQLAADKDAKIEKLMAERDEAIRATLEMKKANSELEAKASQSSTEVTEKMQALQLSIEKTEALLEDKKREIDKLTNDLSHMSDNIKQETEGRQKAIDKLSELKDKLSTSASELITAKSLATDKAAEIAKLITERDEAIKVTLEMKKENEELNDKLNNLAQVQSESSSISKEKISNLAALLTEAEQLTVDRDITIKNLIKEKDEAIQVTMDMKKDYETQKLALNEKIAVSDSALKDAQKLMADRDAEIAKLIAERDEAIKVTLEMKKASADFEAQKSDLDGKLQTLMSTQSENYAVSKEKISNLAALLTEAEQLTVDRDITIKNLIKEKDEAIQVTMDMKKDYETQKLALNEKIAVSDSALKDAQKLMADRDAEIAKLIAERDEAIKVTLEMKKASADFEAQKSDLDGKLQTLMSTQSENDAVSKEKIEKLATALSEADKSILERDEEIEKLTKERDAAIQVTMGLKKESEAFETQKQETTQNESILKEKISRLADLLSEAEKSTIDKDADIERLTKERDAAIQVSMGMQKKLEEGKKASNENAKKLVIDNIVSTFKLSKVEFKTGSAILTDKSTGLLDRVAEIMNNHTEYNYKIQGHTDSQGKEALNLKLSQARADSVKSYLVSKGVADTALSTEGFGASAPIADNATREGRLQNRRVVFEIVD